MDNVEKDCTYFVQYYTSLIDDLCLLHDQEEDLHVDILNNNDFILKSNTHNNLCDCINKEQFDNSNKYNCFSNHQFDIGSNFKTF
jgi:hypothetical protein